MTQPPMPPPMPSDDGARTPPPVPPPAPVGDHDAPAEPLHTVCPTCGSQVGYAPGTTSLRCQSCGGTVDIEAVDATIEEHDYDAWQARHGTVEVASLAEHVLQCQNCGATTETKDIAGTCQFCSGTLIALGHPEGLMRPEGVVPFGVDKRGAQDAFGKWVTSRWFAPTALKKVNSTEGLAGTYVPHWTYDAQTETDYRGQRGEYYYVTVTDRVPNGNGGTKTVTRQERRTRWYPARGHVARFFDDVVVPASTRLDDDRLEKMGPWQLADAVPYQPEYLAGYAALRYDVDPDDGSAVARDKMRDVIRTDCKRDIGGDEQRVSSMDITYSQAMFKLLLMPLWIATYLYGGKTFQVMVNANTGEVVGERPYSWLKITAAVVVGLAVAILLIWVFGSGESSG